MCFGFAGHIQAWALKGEQGNMYTRREGCWATCMHVCICPLWQRRKNTVTDWQVNGETVLKMKNKWHCAHTYCATSPEAPRETIAAAATGVPSVIFDLLQQQQQHKVCKAYSNSTTRDYGAWSESLIRVPDNTVPMKKPEWNMGGWLWPLPELYSHIDWFWKQVLQERTDVQSLIHQAPCWFAQILAKNHFTASIAMLYWCCGWARWAVVPLGPLL